MVVNKRICNISDNGDSNETVSYYTNNAPLSVKLIKDKSDERKDTILQLVNVIASLIAVAISLTAILQTYKQNSEQTISQILPSFQGNTLSFVIDFTKQAPIQFYTDNRILSNSQYISPINYEIDKKESLEIGVDLVNIGNGLAKNVHIEFADSNTNELFRFIEAKLYGRYQIIDNSRNIIIETPVLHYEQEQLASFDHVEQPAVKRTIYTKEAGVTDIEYIVNKQVDSVNSLVWLISYMRDRRRYHIYQSILSLAGLT